MPLNAGDLQATEGLAHAIYQAMEQHLRPRMEAATDDPDDAPSLEEMWQRLSFCIASAVVAHLERKPATAPEYAEVFSSSAQDAAYWAWLSALAAVLREWAATPKTLEQLRAALAGFLGGASGTTPNALRGVLR